MIISTVTPHYSQIPYLQICLVSNIYCNPQISAPCTVTTPGHGQEGKSLSLPPHSFPAEVKQGGPPSCFRSQLETSVRLMVY